MASTAPALESPELGRRFTWRRLAPDELDHERLWASIALIGLGLVLAIPESTRLRLVCPFKMLTGVPCLTCGSNRALSALLHFEPLRALAWNPLVVVTALACGLWVAYAAVVVIGRLPRLRLTGDLRGVRGLVGSAALLAVVANWIYLYVAGI